VLAEIETRAVTSAQALQQVNAQIAAVEREKRMLQLTQSELNSYKKENNVYVGIGKMYLFA
jgi:prefoldin subunit 1